MNKPERIRSWLLAAATGLAFALIFFFGVSK